MRKTVIAQGIQQAFPHYAGTSSIFDMVTAFWPLDRLIEDMLADQVSFAGPVAVMLDKDGSYGEIVPSLAGWCSAFERMARRIGIPLDLGTMRRISRRLDIGMLIDHDDIDRFVQQVNRCRAIFLACPVWIRKQAYLDECIEIALDDLGLREAA